MTILWSFDGWLEVNDHDCRIQLIISKFNNIASVCYTHINALMEWLQENERLFRGTLMGF